MAPILCGTTRETRETSIGLLYANDGEKSKEILQKQRCDDVEEGISHERAAIVVDRRSAGRDDEVILMDSVVVTPVPVLRFLAHRRRVPSASGASRSRFQRLDSSSVAAT